MIFIILIALSLILLGGFFVLVGFERSRGLRIAGVWRNKLDAKVARTAFIVNHVDWGAFVRHLLGSAAERIAHDVAHTVLKIVRTAERFLTRAVKYLRMRRGLAVEEEPEEEVGPIQARVLKLKSAVRNARTASRKPSRASKPVAEDEAR